MATNYEFPSFNATIVHLNVDLQNISNMNYMGGILCFQKMPEVYLRYTIHCFWNIEAIDIVLEPRRPNYICTPEVRS